jgi:hypothetical protein
MRLPVTNVRLVPIADIKAFPPDVRVTDSHRARSPESFSAMHSLPEPSHLL